ncbi:MAG: glycosyl hydrolase [Bacteroidales bacterium]
MKKLFTTLCFVVSTLLSSAQNEVGLTPGFPSRSSKLDVFPGFKNPPKGYGEVSFYWWLGDTLTTERITSQLDQLKDNSITGLQINYCHTDKGGSNYGLTMPSQPALFSDKWWNLFKWFVKEAKARGMSVSLSDYTLGAANQGWYIDEMLNENPSLYGTKLESKKYEVNGFEAFQTSLPSDLMSINAYQTQNGEIASNTKIDLKPFIKNSLLKWTAKNGKWVVIAVYKTTVKTSFDPMNPISGQKVNEKFYQRFEDHCPGESGKGLNFFFSDELQFGIRGFLWNTRFADEFRKKKGYDITRKLDQLFEELGPESYKTRLDYNDVMVSLTEDGFFKPVYNWHNSRGMLFGCDHGGRGQDVTEFGDYFRTQRWLSGPGSDQPNLGENIVKAKVASSISHMYERPRTWLEGYYGSGWGTSSEELANATFTDFAMGHNLLSLHGLYYSTHGSWWEWAAPDNHFRQPYWANMSSFLKCTERLSYILSQGYHCCDVAMIYPVSPTEANLKGKESTKTAFDLANNLYPKGIDFDFMDFESLNRCTIQNKELKVSGEKYKILILPALAAVRYSTIQKALEFYRAGGTVLAVTALPEASDRICGNDTKLQSMIREMFGITYEDKVEKDNTYTKRNSVGGLGMFIPDFKSVANVISQTIVPDFKIIGSDITSNIMHRKVGPRDLYFVYGIPKGTSCFFRSTGKVELWNPWDASTKELKAAEITEQGTTFHLPLEKSEPQLIIFSPGKAVLETSTTVTKVEKTVLEGDWEFELKPTLDNTYGDYRLPAFDDKIGIETWKMKFSEQISNSTNWQNPAFDDSKWSTATVSYGPQFLKLGPLPNDIDTVSIESKILNLGTISINEALEINSKKYTWQPYEFSWRWGLKDDAGHQGYHGLKAEVHDEIISLGKLDKKAWIGAPVVPLLKESEGSVYYLWSTVLCDENIYAKLNIGGLSPTKISINNHDVPLNSNTVSLNRGQNTILLKYNSIGRGYFILEKKDSNSDWQQTTPLSTNWYNKPDILKFNCYPERNQSHGLYRFQSPPGAQVMYITSANQPEVWASSVNLKAQVVETVYTKNADRTIPVWKVFFPDSIQKSAQVALRIEQTPGLFGGAALPEPIRFVCGKGKIQLGDLANNQSLKTYSGGMWYRKTLNVTSQQAASAEISLDLGDLVSSAEVWVNGQSIDIKLTPPWQFDLSGKLKSGDNKLEVLIYNTLGNHYLTTPSKYVGRTKSGLIGPVTISYTKK